MRRIYMIWFIRRALPMLSLEAGVITFVLYSIANQVFVNNVLRNAVAHTFSRSPVMLADFFFHAFLNTEFIIQFFLVAFGIFGILLFKDARRAFRAAAPGILGSFSHYIRTI